MEKVTTTPAGMSNRELTALTSTKRPCFMKGLRITEVHVKLYNISIYLEGRKNPILVGMGTTFYYYR